MILQLKPLTCVNLKSKSSTPWCTCKWLWPSGSSFIKFPKSLGVRASNLVMEMGRCCYLIQIWQPNLGFTWQPPWVSSLKFYGTWSIFKMSILTQSENLQLVFKMLIFTQSENFQFLVWELAWKMGGSMILAPTLEKTKRNNQKFL
jgi:hypothetical protein